MPLLDWIENKDLKLPDGAFAAILGISPSKGARSPSLWNSAFAGLGFSARMVPLDVQEKNLSGLVGFLKHEKSFMGGAVTMPFKTQILPLLDEIEPAAARAGAVNCIYKKAGKFFGTNTDGLAALSTLQAAYQRDLRGAKVLLLGLGGAGSAVAAYVGQALGTDGLLALANRGRAPLEVTAERLRGSCKTKIIASWPVPADLEKFDIVINATSLGFETPRQDAAGWFLPKWFTPLGPGPEGFRSGTKEEAEAGYAAGAAAEISANIAHTLRALERQRGAFFYDIIYQPRETLLLSLARLAGNPTSHGLAMNLEQAVIAFDQTTNAAGLRALNSAEVRGFMEKI